MDTMEIKKGLLKDLIKTLGDSEMEDFKTAGACPECGKKPCECEKEEPGETEIEVTTVDNKTDLKKKLEELFG